MKKTTALLFFLANTISLRAMETTNQNIDLKRIDALVEKFEKETDPHKKKALQDSLIKMINANLEQSDSLEAYTEQTEQTKLLEESSLQFKKETDHMKQRFLMKDCCWCILCPCFCPCIFYNACKRYHK